MKIVTEVYDFITGGSIVAPVLLAVAIAAGVLLHAFRAEAFLGIVIAAFVASTFEKPT